MVRIQAGSGSEYDLLDQLVHELVAAHEFDLDVTGWTRKTYDVYDHGGGRTANRKLLVRVESFVTTNGVVELFDDAGLPFAEAFAARLERDFDGVQEAVIVRGGS